MTPGASDRRLARMDKRILAVAAAALVSSACSKTTIKGTVEVPGNDVRNIAVRIVPKEEIAAYLDKKIPEALIALDRRQTAYKQASREDDWARRDAQEAHARARASGVEKEGVRVTSLDAPGTGLYTFDPNKHTAREAEAIARGNLADAERKRAENSARLAAEKPALEKALAEGRAGQAQTAAWVRAWETDMLADLPEKGTVVYTDEKGAFTATVPRGSTVAVIAQGEFREGTPPPERRAWGLWLKADAAEKPIALTRGNMLLAGPRDSVLL